MPPSISSLLVVSPCDAEVEFESGGVVRELGGLEGAERLPGTFGDLWIFLIFTCPHAEMERVAKININMYLVYFKK